MKENLLAKLLLGLSLSAMLLVSSCCVAELFDDDDDSPYAPSEQAE